MNRLLISVTILSSLLLSCVEEENKPELNVVKPVEITIAEIAIDEPEAISIDSVVFMNEILTPIKNFHIKLFKEDYGVTTKYSKPGKLIETWTDSIYRLDFMLYEFEGTEQEILDSSIYLGRGHSINVPIRAYMNTYNNKSIIKGDIDNDGEDDLLLTTYFYFGGNRGLQTLFLFLTKNGKFTLSYQKVISQDGYQNLKDGIFYGKYSDSGKNGSYYPTHFYITESIFRNGEFVLLKKMLKEYYVEKESGGWKHLKVDSITYKGEYNIKNNIRE